MKYKHLISTLLSVLLVFIAVTYNACSDPCKNVNCVNGGACNDGSCTCPEGYEGRYCETKKATDPCLNIPCENGATCVSGICHCPSFYTGTYCGQELRNSYTKIYKGHGTDNDGEVYENWHLNFQKKGKEVSGMKVDILDDMNLPMMSLDITLKSNTTFEVIQKKDGNDVITGSGTVDTHQATLIVNFSDGTDEFTISFINMIAQ